jgi:hypothetical protein
VPVNYLHRDDAIGLITSVLDHNLTDVFNLVAPQHPTREAVYRQNCTAFGLPLPVFSEPTEAPAYKIVSPAKVQAATGYRFVYPDPLGFHYVPDAALM